MRIVDNYKIPASCSVEMLSFPVVSVFTGNKRYHCISVCTLPCGRTFWVVPRVGYVSSLPFDADILDVFRDGVFYSIDDLYKSLSKGGFFWSLNMSKSYFYRVFGCDCHD